MESIVDILMERDGVSFLEACCILDDMRENVKQGADPEDELYDIGLEPDYIFQLL